MLENALRSVTCLSAVTSVEIVLVDGAGDLRVTELARRFGAKLISGEDRGLYDAWNKGVAIARGEVIGFLNDDDEYLPDVAACLSAFLQSTYAVLSCAALRAEHPSSEESVRVEPHAIGLLNVVGTPNAINARFFRSDMIRRLPEFDDTLRIWADKAWLAELYFHDPPTMLCPKASYFYRTHAESLTMGRLENREALGAERIKALTRSRAEATSLRRRAALRLWLDLAHAHDIFNSLRTGSRLSQRPDGGLLAWGIRIGFWLALVGVPLVLHRRQILRRPRRREIGLS